MPDFEIIQPEPQQPPALRLALDRLTQQRAAEQAELQEQQLWEDTQPPTLTYLGQSNGQSLLQAAGGQPFRAGNRDSNGSLLPGLADVAIGSGSVVRVGGMPRVLEQPAEESTPQQKIAVLFAKTLAETIEFWLGGDRSEPIKVAEIPRFGRTFSVDNSLNTSLSFTLTLQGIQSVDAESPGITTGVNVYQPYLRKDIESSAAVSGSASLIDPEYAGIAGGYMLLPISGAGGTNINNGWSDGPFDYSNSGSYNEDPPDPAEFYTVPSYNLQIASDQPFYRIGAELGSTLASGEELPGDTLAEVTATFNATVSGFLQEINQYRAYLAVTPTTCFVSIAYDLREGGYQELILKQVGGEAIDLNEPATADWRRSMAVKAPTLPSSGNACTNAYQNQLTTNIYQNRLYEIEDSWLQLVTAEGNTFYLYEAIQGTTPVKTKLKLRRLTNSGDTCQIGNLPDIEMTIQPLGLDPSDQITFIAVCAAKD